MASIKLSELTIRELLDYEAASRIICAKYENLNKMQDFMSESLVEKFNVVKGKYDSVVDEIEKRVKSISK